MANKNKSSGIYFVITIMLIAVVVVPLALLYLQSRSERSGVEFCPQDFTARKFKYSVFPLIGTGSDGIKYFDETSETAQILIADGWIKPARTATKQWHLISENTTDRAGRIPAQCDARFLTRYFDKTNPNDGISVLVSWSEAHPKMAKTYWAFIAELARNEMYLAIPELMEFALNYRGTDATAFNQELENRVAEAYFKLGEIDQFKQQHQRAVLRFDRAIEIGNHAEAAIARLKSIDKVDSNVDSNDDAQPTESAEL